MQILMILFAQIMRNMVLKVFLFHESNLCSETIMIEWKEHQCPGFNSCLDLTNYVILGRLLSFSDPLCVLTQN